ncbi:MAG: WYL domain-containing protein [Synechococcaceae cyanobacterium RL_1_2]|nr:WYL domain-containing protein [Synechococcaceae cyanobacterium RL_1_2]
MSRKGESVTLSLKDYEKIELEKLAQEFGCEWGDRPNISKLIKQIAKKELKIAPNNDWPLERINVLERIRKWLIDGGEIDQAIAIAKLMVERSELTHIPLRQELEKFIQQPQPPWRARIDSFIKGQRPFQLSYQDVQEKVWTFSIHHAQIVPHENRQYLDCWCQETEGNQDLPELQHNWSFRLDRIHDAAVIPLNHKWRPNLDIIPVEIHLYRGLAFAYESKIDDLHNQWHPELTQTRQVVRQVSNTFWFIREMRRYGPDCQIITPKAVRDRVISDIRAQYHTYELD